MGNLLEEATSTFNELLRMHKLNAELIETLSVTGKWLRDYTDKYDIPFPNSSTFDSLINKADMLIEEIVNNQTNRRGLYRTSLSDERKHLDDSDGEVTVPT